MQAESREEVAAGVAEYSYRLRVGPNPHDVIGVHRVVHETRPGTPDRTSHAVFFVHGDVWGFDPAFAGKLGGAGRAPNVATWLARRGADVWGIDLRWILVPAHTPDRAFMRFWGPTLDLQDIRVATSVERAVRALTGSGYGPTALLGWSRGGFLAYAYANYESHLPESVRNVDALIPADTLLRYGPKFDATRRMDCRFYRLNKQQLVNGVYGANVAVYAQLGQLALAHPRAASPIISGLTNRQAALAVGAAPNPGVAPWYHFVAGVFDSQGIPNRLKYTPPSRFFRFLSQGSPWEAMRELVKSERVWCGEPDPLVDDLHSIDLPVLYLGAAGGFGATGLYSGHLLGSHDVTTVIARLQPVGQETGDFGHVDLWQASNAARVAWTPLLNWLRVHQ